jgi:hypothetical protein
MTTNSKRKWEKAWQTVGRFLSGFAALEGFINDVFVELYNLEQSSAFMTLVTWPCLKIRPIDLDAMAQVIEQGTTTNCPLSIREGRVSNRRRYCDPIGSLN